MIKGKNKETIFMDAYFLTNKSPIKEEFITIEIEKRKYEKWLEPYFHFGVIYLSALPKNLFKRKVIKQAYTALSRVGGDRDSYDFLYLKKAYRAKNYLRG